MRRTAARFVTALTLAGLLAPALNATAGAAAPAAVAAPRVDDELTVGEQLLDGDSLVSPSGRFALQVSGQSLSLVDVETAAGVRAANTALGLADGVDRVVLQPDGNLVATGPQGDVRWHSWTWGTGTTGVRVQDDGNVVMNGGVRGITASLDTYRRGRLLPGATLRPGESVPSEDLGAQLVMQHDGNLVLYRGSVPLWQSGTAGADGASATFRYTPGTDQRAAELAVVDEDGALLSRVRRGSMGPPFQGSLVAQLLVKDTALAFATSNGQQIRGYVPVESRWGSDWASDRLAPGDVMIAGDRRVSASGRYVLLRQVDRNLVLLRDGVPVWATGVGPTLDPPDRWPVADPFTVMQRDGNLVTYGARSSFTYERWALTPTATGWNTGTSVPGSSAVVQDDGNLVVVGPDGRPVWSRLTGPLR